MEPFSKFVVTVVMAAVICLLAYLCYNVQHSNAVFREQCNRAGGEAAIPSVGTNKCMRDSTFLYDDATK